MKLYEVTLRYRVSETYHVLAENKSEAVEWAYGCSDAETTDLYDRRESVRLLDGKPLPETRQAS